MQNKPIYINSTNKPLEIKESSITPQLLLAKCLSNDQNSEDFIFFSDKGNKFLNSNNDLVREYPLYGLSLFQARRFIKNIDLWESKFEELGNVKEKLTKLEKEDEPKTAKIQQLERQIEQLERQIEQLEGQLKKFQQQQSIIQNTQQLDITIIDKKKINELENQKFNLDQELFKLKLEFNVVKDNNIKLQLENDSLKKNFEKTNNELGDQIKQNKLLREQSTKNIQTYNSQNSEQQLKNDLSEIENTNVSLQQRLQEYEKKYKCLAQENERLRTHAYESEYEYECLTQENQRLKEQLSNLKTQQTQQAQQSYININKTHQSEQKLREQELQHIKLIKEKQQQMDNLKSEKDQIIIELQKQIMSFENKSTDPTKSQLNITNQKDKKIEEQAKLIERLQKEMLQAENNYQDLQNEFQTHFNQIKLQTSQTIMKDNVKLNDDLENAKLKIAQLDKENKKLKEKLDFQKQQGNQYLQSQQKQMTTLAQQGLNSLNNY